MGNIITDNKVAADIFNDYFASVFTREDTNNIPVPDQIFVGSKSEYLSDISIDEHVVYNKLNNLNVNKSPGSDDLHPKLLYELREHAVS